MHTFLSILPIVLFETTTILCDISFFFNDLGYSRGDVGPYPTQTFYSDSEIVAPIPNVVKVSKLKDQTERFVTWAAHGDKIPPTGPQLLDTENLSVVYQTPTYGEDTFGLSVQSCNGTDYLVWWAGTNIDGRAGGHYYILNSTYDLVWNVSTIGLEWADAHDMFLTPDCHAVFTSYQPRPFELAEFTNLTDNSWLLDSYFQEVDLATNELVFQWRASDHIDMHESYWLPEIEQQGDLKWHGWDFFHINSVQKDVKGNFLVSARHTNALYYINGITGAVIWRLGGKQSDFRSIGDHDATHFSWQHHARWVDERQTMVSLFDDRSCGYFQEEDPVSRGIVIRLDVDEKTIELLKEYRAPDGIISMRKGGMQRLEDGRVVLGFGSEPAFTEYSEEGEILWDVRFGPIMQDIDRATADNYRAYKVNWVGRPTWPPKIALGPSPNQTGTVKGNKFSNRPAENDTVYFSWNGATEVVRWTVFASNVAEHLISQDHKVLQVKKAGFESSVFIGQAGKYVCAIAFDKHDSILGSTPILDVESGVELVNSDELLRMQLRIFINSSSSTDTEGQTLHAVMYSLVAIILFGLLVWIWRNGLRILQSLLTRLMRLRGYDVLVDEEEKRYEEIVLSSQYEISDASAVSIGHTTASRHTISHGGIVKLGGEAP